VSIETQKANSRLDTFPLCELLTNLPDRSQITALVENIFSNIVANLFSSIILLVVGFLAGRWSDYTRKTRAFRRIFGKRAGKSGDLLIVLDTIRDTRLLPSSEQQKIGISNPAKSQPSLRFFKLFPDGHFAAINGPTGNLLPECSARGASYLLDAFRGVRRISTKTVSDDTASPQWNGTFIALGSSYSNIKTDDIKHLPENPWLLNDSGEFTLKDGTTIKMEHRYDKGLIMKLPNPHCDGHALIVCEGLGEWGTSGSAWFLATHWRRLSKRFGNNPFLLVLRVTTGTDESAREVQAFGVERWTWRIRKWFRIV
jgi:hypothetical protein